MYLHIKIIRKKKFDRNSQNTLFGRIESIINTKIIRQIKNCNKKKKRIWKKANRKSILKHRHSHRAVFICPSWGAGAGNPLRVTIIMF